MKIYVQPTPKITKKKKKIGRQTRAAIEMMEINRQRSMWITFILVMHGF